MSANIDMAYVPTVTMHKAFEEIIKIQLFRRRIQENLAGEWRGNLRFSHTQMQKGLLLTLFGYIFLVISYRHAGAGVS